MSLQGTVGAVTGAGTPFGIGRSAVFKYAKAGAKRIYACDLFPTHFEKLVEDVKKECPEVVVTCLQVDVASEEAVEKAVRQIISDEGRLDWFFSNAGIVDFTPLERTSHATMLKQFNVNTLGALNCIQWASRAMMTTSATKEQPGGRIVVTTSLASICGGNAPPAYTASKHAAAGLVRSCSAQFDFSGTPIGINSVAPGPTMSNIAQATIASGSVAPSTLAAMAAKGKDIDMTKLLHPDDIAAVAVFLSTPESGGIRGQNIVVDKGTNDTVAAFSGVYEAAKPEAL